MTTLQERTRDEQEDRRRLVELARQAGMPDQRIARALRVGKRYLPPSADQLARAKADIQRRETFERKDGPPTMGEIERCFMHTPWRAGWPVDGFDIREPTTRRTVTRPRHVCMWLIRQIMGSDASFPAIALHFGMSDHTTAIYAIGMRGAPFAMQLNPTLDAVAQAVLTHFKGDLIK